MLLAPNQETEATGINILKDILHMAELHLRLYKL